MIGGGSISEKVQQYTDADAWGADAQSAGVTVQSMDQGDGEMNNEASYQERLARIKRVINLEAG